MHNAIKNLNSKGEILTCLNTNKNSCVVETLYLSTDADISNYFILLPHLPQFLLIQEIIWSQVFKPNAMAHRSPHSLSIPSLMEEPLLAEVSLHLIQQGGARACSMSPRWHS